MWVDIVQDSEFMGELADMALMLWSRRVYVNKHLRGITLF
jgi:hypothetical protein